MRIQHLKRIYGGTITKGPKGLSLDLEITSLLKMTISAGRNGKIKHRPYHCVELKRPVDFYNLPSVWEELIENAEGCENFHIKRIVPQPEFDYEGYNTYLLNFDFERGIKCQVIFSVPAREAATHYLLSTIEDKRYYSLFITLGMDFDGDTFPTVSNTAIMVAVVSGLHYPSNIVVVDSKPIEVTDLERTEINQKFNAFKELVLLHRNYNGLSESELRELLDQKLTPTLADAVLNKLDGNAFYTKHDLTNFDEKDIELILSDAVRTLLSIYWKKSSKLRFSKSGIYRKSTYVA